MEASVLCFLEPGYNIMVSTLGYLQVLLNWPASPLRPWDPWAERRCWSGSSEIHLAYSRAVVAVVPVVAAAGCATDVVGSAVLPASTGYGWQ
jgi:hypothetical protein